jgi:hypothetical protein
MDVKCRFNSGAIKRLDYQSYNFFEEISYIFFFLRGLEWKILKALNIGG